MKHLLNNYVKKIAFLFVVISIITALSGWKSFIFKPTDFSQLKIIEGEILFGPSQGGSKNTKPYTPIYLASGNINTEFYGHQFNYSARQLYRRKHAKAWVDKDNLLYQLETDGKKVISYDLKKAAYIKSKQESVIFDVTFISIALLFFYMAQLAEPPSKR